MDCQGIATAFPRSADRGHIEAPHCWTVGLLLLAFRGQLTAATLKLVSVAQLPGVASPFRGRLTAATLKPIHHIGLLLGNDILSAVS